MLMTEREALHALGIPRTLLLELVETGRLRRYFRNDRHGRFARHEVYALFEGRLPPPLPSVEPPRRRGGVLPGGHLYALEIVGVGTKVGLTQAPSKRLAEHARAARNHGRKTGRVWVSIRHAEVAANELALAPLRGGRRAEYLSESFASVMRRIERLPMTPVEAKR